MQKINMSIREQQMKPNVYAMELVCKEFSYLHIVSAYSLEEALASARKYISIEFAKVNIPIAEWILRKYVYLGLKEILDKHSKINISDEMKIDKNLLMKRIISEKNNELYDKHIRLFTKSEKKLLEEKLGNLK